MLTTCFPKLLKPLLRFKFRKFRCEVVPFINFYDPENGVNGIGGVGAGDWSVDDRPYLTNTGANDDQIVTFARTTWTATAGDYTIRVRGDDGYGLRIQGGATVVRTKGEGRNKNGGDGASSSFACTCSALHWRGAIWWG